MSATSRPARLSSEGQVVAILVGTAVAGVALVATVFVLFVVVLIPFLQFGGKGEIPANFPVFPGAHLDSAIATSYAGCSAVDASWSTNAGESRVIAFYREELNSAGWTIVDEPSGGNSIDFSSTSGQTHQGVLTVESGPEGSTYISVIFYTSSGASSNSRCVYGRTGP